MKQNNLKKGIEEIKKISLSQTEKEVMLHAILKQPVVLPYRVKSPFFLQLRALSVACVAFILIIGVTTASAAENSLPGDALYSLKVNVNEPIRGVMSVTGVEKATWEVEKAGRRIIEVQKLAAKGRIDEKKKDEIEQKFEEEIEVQSKRLDDLERSSKNDTKKKEIKKAKKKIKDKLEKIKEEKKKNQKR